MYKWFALLAASIVMFGTAACGGGGGDDQTIDLGDGNEVSVSDDLPNDFPDSFPIYEGADLQGTTRGEQDGITGIVATWTTGDSFDDVVAFYNDAFESGEWSVTLTGSAGGSTYWAVGNTDGSKAGYVAISDGDDTLISATVGDNPDGASGSTDDGSGSGEDSSGDGSSDDGSSSGDGSSDGDSSSDGTDSDNVSDPSDDDTGESAGSADLPDEVALPDEFPTDLVSIPEGARITSGQSYSSNGQDTFMVGFMTEESVDDVADAFASEMSGKGYTETLRTSDGTGVYAAYTENDDGTGTVIVLSLVESSSYDGYFEGVLQVTTGVAQSRETAAAHTGPPFLADTDGRPRRGHPSRQAISSSSTIRSSNRERWFRKRMWTTPVGPLRCLATMSFVMPSGYGWSKLRISHSSRVA